MLDKKREDIRAMFGSIARRYDRLNHLLSLSIDRYWRRITVRKLVPFLPHDALILDLCTGTGDLALGLAPLTRVVGCDFCRPMLALGVKKVDRTNLNEKICFVEGDALHLPFPSECFHGVTIGFGLRNLEDYGQGLREMLRVLRVDGVLAVLEFSEPQMPWIRPLYLFYFTRILPKLGKWVSGQESPYSYLPASVKEFPAPGELDKLIQHVGFANVQHDLLTGGVATLHLARKRRLQC